MDIGGWNKYVDPFCLSGSPVSVFSKEETVSRDKLFCMEKWQGPGRGAYPTYAQQEAKEEALIRAHL